MTKGEIISLYNNLGKLGHLKGVKFAYMVARNLSLIKPEIEALEKALQASKEYTEYDNKRIALAKSHAVKDENGEAKVTVSPIDPNATNYVIEDEEAFNKAFLALREEYKTAIEERSSQIKEQNELLKTPSTLELYKVSLSEVPTEISTDEMRTIVELVEEGIPSPFKS